jgi:hypothetical protein
MKKVILKILTLTLSVLFALSNSGLAKTPRYPNTYSKDFMADAPWRVQGKKTKIPVGFFIKDSDDNDLPDLNYVEIYLLKKDGTQEKIYSHSFGGLRLNQFYWEWVAESFENAEDATLNGKPITAENLGYDVGDIIELKAYIRGSDQWWQGGSFSISRRLRVFVENPFPKPDSDWLYGDDHYHTKYTTNPYEYGAGIATIRSSLESLGLDWVTTTDHASNYSWYDLNETRWGQLKNEIAEFNNPSSGLPFIIGEEIACEPIAGTDKNVIHLLTYNNDSFIPGTINVFNDALLSLESRLTETVSDSNNVLAFAAHPSDTTDIFGVGDIRVWSDTNFQTAMKFQNFYGLEVWNTRKTMSSPGGNLDHINPFTGADGGWATKESEGDKDNHFLPNLESAISKWILLLENNLNPIRKIVINAGSDAHGDLNYFSNMGLNLERLSTNDNAIGKVRTLVYAPEHDKSSVLGALQNGNSIITDGPSLLIGVDVNNDEKLVKKEGDFIVGDIISVQNSDVIPLMISWQLYNSISIQTVNIYLGNEKIHEFKPENDVGDGYLKIQIPLKNRQLNSYLRAECITDTFVNYSGFNDRYRAYTNPIWLQDSDIMKGDIDGNLSVDMRDTISILKIVSGVTPDILIHKSNGIGTDGKIGIEDAVYTLKVIPKMK